MVSFRKQASGNTRGQLGFVRSQQGKRPCLTALPSRNCLQGRVTQLYLFYHPSVQSVS